MKNIIFALATLLVLFAFSFNYQFNKNKELKILLEKKSVELEYSNKLIREREENYEEQKDIVADTVYAAENADFIEQLCLNRQIPDSFFN